MNSSLEIYDSVFKLERNLYHNVGTKSFIVANMNPLKFIIKKSSFYNLSNNDNGGVIYFDSFLTSIVIEDCIFSENNALLSGGVFYIIDSGDISLINNTFENNNAFSGGVIYYDQESI